MVTTIPRLRHEKVARLHELIDQRELATSEAAYDGLTVLVDEMFREIKRPIPQTFVNRLEAQRQPWVKVIEALLAEMSSGRYKHPYKFDTVSGLEVLLVRPWHVMNHLHVMNLLDDFWENLPVRADTELRRQLWGANVLLTNNSGRVHEVERTLNARRVPHLHCLALKTLAQSNITIPAALVADL